jgi:hypothetical protein
LAKLHLDLKVGVEDTKLLNVAELLFVLDAIAFGVDIENRVGSEFDNSIVSSIDRCVMQ